MAESPLLTSESTLPTLALPDSSFIILSPGKARVIDRFSSAIHESRQALLLECARVDGLAERDGGLERADSLASSLTDFGFVCTRGIYCGETRDTARADHCCATAFGLTNLTVPGEILVKRKRIIPLRPTVGPKNIRSAPATAHRD